MEDIPFKDYEEIRKIANAFLAKYHPSGALPIPIEDIIDRQLRINIIPMPGLRNITNIDGADAFTYRDKRSIAVDEFVYNKRPARYRFTLAHEIGHIELHQSYFDLSINSIDDWKKYAGSLDDYQHVIMEYQANCFAGLVLVPGDRLKEKVQEALAQVRQINGYSKLPGDFIWETLESKIASCFEVSQQVVHIRIEKDKLHQVFNKEF